MTTVQPTEQISAYPLHNVPAELMEAIRADSRKRGMSVNNIMCEVMAARYKMVCGPSERAPREGRKDLIFIRLPPAVMNKVRAEAWKHNITMRSIFLSALAAHYNYPPPKADKATGSGRPRQKGTP